MAVSDLIERGYLPWEVPPCFNSVSLSQYAAGVGLPALLAAHAPTWTRPARHNLARPGGLRRPLSVPNPLNFIELAHEVDGAWLTEIDPGAKLSRTRPVPSFGPRAFAPQTSDGESEAKATARSGGRVLLRADIQNFYPSVYTHSIPWALHTKVVAKAQMNDMALAGNRIDKAIRRGQEGQTMGIPIGPDTSWVLAECILARVEASLLAKLGTLRGHRYNDDIELVFKSVSDAERALATIHESLADFELSVNARKTRISELPDRVEGRGISDLRRWQFRSQWRAQLTDIVGYFDLVAQFIQADRGSHTASYAVARIRTQEFLPNSWPLLEAQLLQLLVAEPYCAKQVAITLSMLTAKGHAVNADALAHAVERVIVYHAPLAHGSEVAWALWLAIAHDAAITAPAAEAIAPMDDCFVALLALHALAKGSVVGNLDTTHWAAAMTTEELSGPRWLLAYEAKVKGWLPSHGGGDHLAAAPFFAALAQAGVSFYDDTGFTLTFEPHQLLPAVGGGGGGPSPIAGT